MKRENTFSILKVIDIICHNKRVILSRAVLFLSTKMADFPSSKGDVHQDGRSASYFVCFHIYIPTYF